MTLADQGARERIASDLDTTLIIEAAAGTGKTTELVNRIVAVLCSGRTTLDRIVAVTFTDKAAGELKLRLRERIERARRAPGTPAADRARLEQALPELEQARIGTIHSFCADLLRERPVEAEVDPLFEVAPQDVAEGLLGRAFDRWFECALAAPGPGLRRLLSRRDFDHDEGPKAMLRRAARELCEWRDFDRPWASEDLAREPAIDALLEAAAAVAGLAAGADPASWLCKSLEEVGRAVKEALRLEEVRGTRDYDALEAALVAMLKGRAAGHWRWKGAGERFGPHRRADVLARRDALHERLREFRAAAGADLAPHLRAELWPVVENYRQLKRRAGKLDFMDLLLQARDLVRANANVRLPLQQRFTHIFIDEFQDTDPLQAELLLLLAADDPAETNAGRVRPLPGKLFVVGDPKQSIYRFRRADLSLYQKVKVQLLEGGAALEHLTVSFRATPRIQEVVNSAFAPLMEQSATQAGYEPLQPWRSDHQGQPSLVVLPVPQPYADYGKIREKQIEQSLPDAVGAFVDWLINRSGWRVTERDDPERTVAVRPRHVCVLFRRFNDFGRAVARPYVRALEARYVPHLLVRGSSFHEREEIEALRNALGAIERPDDELVVFATLRGPLFALSDGALLVFRESLGSLHPFRKLPEDLSPELAEVASALAVLRELHRGRNRRPLADTIARLLTATRAHAGFAMWPTGEQTLANVQRLMDGARRYEARGDNRSFRGFVEQLEAEAEGGEPGEAPVVEEGAEGVRLMTVHSAKGLEFPVVILADITCKETAVEAARYVDPERGLCALKLGGCSPRELLDHQEEELRRDAEEAVRVLYVAVTRARDLLVVPALGDEIDDDRLGRERARWVDRLAPILYPDFDRRRAPLSRRPVGCPEFGDDSVAGRPERAPGKNKAVSPGTHRAAAGAHPVVWWDPSRLELGVRERMGLRQMKLLQADDSRRVSEQGIQAYEDWHARRVESLARAAEPAMRVVAATEVAEDAQARQVTLAEAADVVLEEVAREPDRPHGPRFGTLVHEVLLSVRFDSAREEIARTAAFRGRILGASGEEVEAAAKAVGRALGSQVMTRARQAGGARCRRECPVLVRLDDGSLVEGIADLAFLDGDDEAQWTVVDFKTDLEIAGRADQYRAQLALYLRGLRAASGRPARGVILWT